MAAALPAALLTLGLLAQVPSPPVASSGAAGERTLEMAVDEPQAYRLRIRAGNATVLLLPPGLRAERLVLEAQEHFQVAGLDSTGHALTLLASRTLKDGALLKGELHLQAAATPRVLRLLLEVVQEGADEVVRVQRAAQASATWREAFEAERKRRMQLEEENARLRSATPMKMGLTDAVASGVAVMGIQLRWLGVLAVQGEDTALGCSDASSYRAEGSVAVAVLLENPVGATPWHAVGAEAKAEDGTRLRVLRVWQDAPIVGGAMGWVIVEAEAPVGPADTPYQLDLWTADGTRRLSLPEVRFPAEPHPQGAQNPSPESAPREQAEEPRKNPVPHVR